MSWPVLFYHNQGKAAKRVGKAVRKPREKGLAVGDSSRNIAAVGEGRKLTGLHHPRDTLSLLQERDW